MLSRSKLCPNVNSNHHSPLFRYGTRLNGVVLDSLSMATFCKMRAGSYVRIITPRSATPPPSTQVDSSRNSEDISGDAVDRNANLWTAGPQDILNMIDSHERASLASNRWTVDHQDTLDNLEQSMQDLQENAYNGKHPDIKCFPYWCLFYFRSVSLVNEQRIFLDTSQLPCGLKGFGEFYGWKTVETFCIHHLS